MSKEPLDLAIGGAVREMLDVEPPADLRARVLTRIDALSPNSVASAFSPNSVASAFRRKIVWFAVPAAAAAMIILAILAPWRQTAAPVSHTLPAVARVEPQPVVPTGVPKPAQPPRTASMPQGHAASSGHPPATRGIEDRLIVTAAVPTDEATTIDPLSPLSPIAVGAVRPSDIAPKEIAISPLAPIAELQIAPLSPPERRN